MDVRAQGQHPWQMSASMDPVRADIHNGMQMNAVLTFLCDNILIYHIHPYTIHTYNRIYIYIMGTRL